MDIINRATFYSDANSKYLDMYRNNIANKDFKANLSYEPYDVVYTWVNGSDPKHQKQVAYFKNLLQEHDIPHDSTDQLNVTQESVLSQFNSLMNTSIYQHNETHANNTDNDNSVNGANRYRDNDELRYSLRSLMKYAGWVRNIYIVTSGQVPSWLNVNHPKIRIVPHSEIFLNQSHLPVFSSPAIEANIHRIKGLSDKFIYLNDDVMFGNYVYPEDFFSKSTGYNVFLSWGVPDCSPGCTANWIGDGYCDSACNVTACDFDGGDCLGKVSSRFSSSSSWSSGSVSTSSWFKAQEERKRRQCSPRCANAWIGDKFCDKACNISACGYDAGDCGVKQIQPLTFDLKSNSNYSYEFAFDTYPESAFFNLSSIFTSKDDEITSGSHDNSEVVRTSTISQTYKLLTLTFLPNNSNALVNVNIEGRVNNDNVNINILLHMPSNHTETVNLKTEVAEELDLAETEENSNIDEINVDEDENTLLTASSSTPTSETIPPITTESETVPSKKTGSKTIPSSKVKETPVKKYLDKNEAKRLQQEDTISALRETTGFILSQESTHKVAKQKRDIGEDPIIHKGDTIPQRPETGTLNDDFEEDQEEEIEEEDITTSLQDILSGKSTRSSRKVLSIDEQPVKLTSHDKHTIHHHTKSNYKTKIMLLDKQKELAKLKAKLEAELQTEGQEHQRLFEKNQIHQRMHFQRKVLDKFGDSLIHVNKLLNALYGRVSRKVPAHMPHLIDKHIMKRIYETWPGEYNVTSSNRFRSSDDMQYTFTYFYYIMHNPLPYNDRSYFNELDRNSNGVLDEYELRYFAHVLNEKGVTKSELEDILHPNITMNSKTTNSSTSTTSSSSSSSSSTTSTSSDFDFSSSFPPSPSMRHIMSTVEHDDDDSISALQKFMSKNNHNNSASSLDSGSNNTSTDSNSTDTNSTNSSSGFNWSNWKSWSWAGSGSLYQSKSSEELFEEYFTLIREIFGNTSLKLDSPSITFNVFNQSGLNRLAASSLNGTVNEFPFTLRPLDEVGFHMIRDDELKVARTLDGLRFRKPKFICLNDDMNQTHPNPKVLDILHNFYNWYFPEASPFELPRGVTNKFLYIDELDAYNASRNRIYFYGFMFLIVLGMYGCYRLLCGTQVDHILPRSRSAKTQ